MKTLFFALLACVSLNANAALIQFSLSDDEINVGESTILDVSVILGDNESFDGFTMEVLYDFFSLESVNIINPFLSNPDVFFDGFEGYVLMSGDAALSFTGEQSLFSIEFLALSAGVFDLELAIYDFFDDVGDAANPQFIDIDVINAPSATLTVNAVPAPQTAALMLLAVAGLMVSRRRS
ncbi:hypothetical protein [Alteromonas antoniana]|uniref:hypothetical protein n=1 Tax=Alteromonas antoniana TaxID=2803813 RepID=UPI001C4406D5|nr:hypothetical protein [Alteromonas antoniana]